MSNVTAKQLISEVRRLAADNPDFIYPDFGAGPNEPKCLYVPDDRQPGCIFGQAFINLGIQIPKSLDRDGINVHLERLGIEATRAQRTWCSTVQTEQDTRLTWGHGVKEADKYIAEVFTDNAEEVHG
jgi:hypothetical protein